MVQQHFILQNVYGKDDETTTKNTRGKIFRKKKKNRNRFTYYEFFDGGLCLFLNCGRENFGCFNVVQINSKNGDAVIDDDFEEN